LRDAIKSNKTRGYQLSDETRQRMRFNLIITNASAEDLPAENVYLIYKIRWQIELNFKIWKSIIKIDEILKMKYERFMCMLLAKLLLICLNYELISNVRNYLYTESQKLLSYSKSFITLKSKVTKIRNLFFLKSKALLKEVLSIVELLLQNNWLEKKNKKDGLENIIEKTSNAYGISK
jgi:hypothetical protein